MADEFDQFDQASSEDDLAAMGESLNAVGRARQDAARREMETAKAELNIAAIAKGMSRALADNTRAMEELRAGNLKAARDASEAEKAVYRRIEAQTAKTLRLIDECARRAVENSQKSAAESVARIEAAKRAYVAAVAGTTAACALALIVVTLVALGLMQTALATGGSWLNSWGWLALPLAVFVCAVAGVLIARELARHGTQPR